MKQPNLTVKGVAGNKVAVKNLLANRVDDPVDL